MSPRFKEVLTRLSKAYPNNCGASTHKTGPRVLIELYFASPAEIDLALQQGIYFDDGMRILPCRVMGPDVDITRVRLTSLPRMPIPSLLEGPKTSLQHFGNVLDCGIYHETDS